MMMQFNNCYATIWYCLVGSEAELYVTDKCKYFIFFRIAGIPVILYKEYMKPGSAVIRRRFDRNRKEKFANLHKKIEAFERLLEE